MDWDRFGDHDHLGEINLVGNEVHKLAKETTKELRTFAKGFDGDIYAEQTARTKKIVKVFRLNIHSASDLAVADSGILQKGKENFILCRYTMKAYLGKPRQFYYYSRFIRSFCESRV